MLNICNCHLLARYSCTYQNQWPNMKETDMKYTFIDMLPVTVVATC